jgi:hypothetical protein
MQLEPAHHLAMQAGSTGTAIVRKMKFGIVGGSILLELERCRLWKDSLVAFQRFMTA